MSKKVLIVEDNQSLSKVMADTFEDEGFEVKTAADGEEGLESAKSWGPDLILLDLLMPKMSGVEMLKQLRKTPEGKEVLVMALTNSENSEQVLELMSLGVNDYLTKSDWGLEELVDKVKDKLKV